MHLAPKWHLGMGLLAALAAAPHAFAEAPAPGPVNVRVTPEHVRDKTISPATLAAFQSMMARRRIGAAASQGLRKRVEAIVAGAKYSQATIEEAAKRAGLDHAAMKADYATLASTKDLTARRALATKLAEKYGPLLSKTLAAAKIDAAAERRRLKDGAPLETLKRPLENDAGTLVWLPLPLQLTPPPPPPPPQAVTLPLGAPFAIHGTTGNADANPTTGRIDALYDSMVVTVGDSSAEVANPFVFRTRLTRAVARVTLDTSTDFNGGVLGYSAGSVSAWLTVADPSGRELCSQRKDIAQVEISGAGGVNRYERETVGIDCSFTRDARNATDEPLTASVHVWAYSSTVGLGLLTASIDATPTAFSVTLSP
jgi:hypothetical protein